MPTSTGLPVALALGALMVSGAGCRLLAGYDTPPPSDAAAPDGQAHEEAGRPDSLAAVDPLCLKPAELTLGTVFQGDTTQGSNAFAQLTCRYVGPGSLPLGGPQQYLSFSAEKARWYRIEVAPDFEAFVYVFTGECTAPAIEADCQSRGGTTAAGTSGDSSRIRIPAGHRQALYFWAPRAGRVRIAVDSDDPAKAGAFSLVVEPLTTIPGASCEKASSLTIGGPAVGGNIGPTLTPDQPSPGCVPSAQIGPQTYYRFDAQAGHTYRVAIQAAAADKLTAYLVSSCSASDCLGYGSPLTVPYGKTGYLHLALSNDGPVWLAIDSPGEHAYGRFTVAVDEIVPPENDACTKPTALPEDTPVVGTTAFLSTLPEPTCGAVNQRSGPQAFFEFDVANDSVYDLTVRPSFEAWPYVLRAGNCSAAALELDCRSGGLSGLDLGRIDAFDARTALLRPTTPGTYLLGVDSLSNDQMGPFELYLHRRSTLNETACAAQMLSPGTVAAPLQLQGDTRGMNNEFGSTIDCGLGQPLIGPQLYYTFTAQAKELYRISLTPDFDGAVIYLFTVAASCGDAVAVQGSCGTFANALAVVRGQTKTMAIQLDPAADVTIAVDSTTPAGGPFVLGLAKQ